MAAAARSASQCGERSFRQAEAEEFINPLLEKVFIIGDSPVSILADACPQVEAAQTCEAI